MKDKDILDNVLIDLNSLAKKATDIVSEIYALEQTIKLFRKEENKEETTIEDEIMSALKDIIDEKSFKNVRVKVVKVDEKDE